jgi:hypothetical protein
MAAVFKAAFLDFQQHGKRIENELLAYEAIRMHVDKQKLGPDVKHSPVGIVKHNSSILGFIVEHWKQRQVPLTRLPFDRGYLFASIKSTCL